MLAYQYDADGYYAEAIEDFGLLPNNATYVEPVLKAGFIPKWNGSAWEQVENHKDEEGYLNGGHYRISEYGPYPDGFSKTLPEPSEEEKLKNAQAQKLDEIEKAYDAAMTASITMPTGNPSQADVAVQAALFAAEDAEGLEYLASRHAETRDELIVRVMEAESPEEVEEVQVRFAV